MTESEGEVEYCKYRETWIFCSDGSGNYPKGGKQIYYYENEKEKRFGNPRNVTKEDNEKEIIPFLETVSEFNRKGGALLLFCYNEPYVLEANLLLNKYLKFEKDEWESESANFYMGGNYVRNKNKSGYIYPKKKEDKNNYGKFVSEEYIKSPGKHKRYSLRIGVRRFEEGINLSYAKKFQVDKGYEPFTPFAYLTDEKEEKAFILYYDPEIKDNKLSRGPIIVHGGLTSAFSASNETGKFIISSAFWLARIEERLQGNSYDLKIPKIEGKKIKDDIFEDWIHDKIKIYTILILDISGSMHSHYKHLIKLANDIIDEEKKYAKNEGAIIFFASTAKIIRGETKKKYSEFDNLKDDEITSCNVDTGNTVFKEALILLMRRQILM